MRILFIGCVKSSYLLLNKLLSEDVNICGVITSETSKFNNDFYDLVPLCVSHNIEYRYSQTCRDTETFDFIQSINPDIIYCFGWSYLLDEEIIDIPRLGVVGFHPAKLPNNKGRHPLIWALVLGLEATASSFFMINKEADSGSIISQVDVPILFEDDASTLYDKIMKVACEQVTEFTRDFVNGTVSYRPQKSLEGNVWRKRKKEDGKIDFRMSSVNIYNLIRGLTKPYVGAHIEYVNKDYKVWSSRLVMETIEDYKNIEPGKVIKVYNVNSFLVKTGDGVIKITECDNIDLKEGDYL